MPTEYSKAMIATIENVPAAMNEARVGFSPKLRRVAAIVPI
jgi:hypothetical protein